MSVNVTRLREEKEMATTKKRKRGPFRLGDNVILHDGSVRGYVAGFNFDELVVREHDPHGTTWYGRRREWHHDVVEERPR